MVHNKYYYRFTCVDPEPSSGCTTKYRINNASWMDYVFPFSINNDGIWTIEYYSVDGAGNTEMYKAEH